MPFLKDQWCARMSSEFSGAEIFSRALPFDSTPTFSFASSPRGIKLKRSRQRVDAGQPRNSYSGQKGTPTSPAMSTTPFASSPSAHPFEAPISAPSPFTSLFHPSQMNAFYRLQQQALLSSTNLNDDSAKLTNNNTTATVALVEETPTVESNGNDTKTCDTCEDKEDEAEEVEEVAAKRSRVENIISNFHSAPSSPNVNADTSGSADVKSEGDEQRSVSAAGSETSPRSKRKQYQPQKETNGATQENGLEEDTEKEKAEEPVVDRVQHLLELQRRQYMEWIEAQQKARAGKEKEGEPEQNGAEDLRQHLKNIGGHKEIVGLSSALKSELLASITATVDRIMGDYIEKEQARFQAQMRAVEASRNQAAARASNPAYSLFNPYGAYGAALGAYGASFPHFPTSTASSNASIFPGSFASSPFPGSMHNNPFSAADSVARKDPFSLINMNKRKRSKVTDTRLGGRMGLKEEGSRGSPNGYYPPTMVGHPLYGSTLPGLGLDELRDNDSPSFSDDLSYESGPVDPNIPQSSTLTPMHLRKAKLMFFYTRYPSSTLIKTYFPDIRFNKNTTAQLVKWFSNFREFYYIQMEKFARQALAEGIRRPEDIHVSTDGDLYKTLNQHYNRNNHIQVPVEFRDVVEATLREFFLSLQAGKDVESSWKKQIYKVIARLDSSIPDYFKNPHFLDQLE